MARWNNLEYQCIGQNTNKNIAQQKINDCKGYLRFWLALTVRAITPEC